MQKLSEKPFLFFLFAIFVILIIVRYNYRHIPFERDEGEYAYAGSLLLHGHHPYSEAYNMKFPGTYFMYALLMRAGGESIEAIRLGVCVIAFLTALLIACIVYLLTVNFAASVLSLTIYIALTNTMGSEGLMANAEHFVNLFAVAGILCLLLHLLKFQKLLLLFASGLLLGTSIIMKQYGYPFCLLGLTLFIIYYSGKPLGKTIKALLIFSLGGVLPITLLAVWLLKNSLWQKFWFLTVQYAVAYLKYYPTDTNAISARTGSFLALLLMSLLACLFYFRKNKMERIAIAWLIFSIPAVSTGGLFRLHYFILAYPALAAGMAIIYHIISVRKERLNMVAKIVVVAVFSFFLIYQRNELFAVSPLEIFKKHYKYSFFEEMPQIANKINSLLPKKDKLNLFSCEPELFFYTGRVAASGYIYNYPLFEPQPYALQMTDEFIHETEVNSSRLFVYQAPPQVYNDSVFAHFSAWWNQYSKKFYLKGLYYRDSDTSGLFLWDKEMEPDTSWKQSDRLEFWVRKE